MQSTKNITAFGEILWDIYPEEKHLGGAPFNFIYHIQQIIGNANFISSVGNDELGQSILSRLDNFGFNTKLIFVDEEHPTGTVLVELDENKSPRFKPSYNCCFDFLRLNNFTESILNEKTDLLYFGTFSARSETTRNTLLSIIKEKNKKYFCDLNLRHNFYTKELVEQALLSSNIIKLNDEELIKLRQMFLLPNDDKEACHLLISKYNIDLIGLTHGANGATLVSETDYDFCKLEQTEICDTLGAGDAFAAILCLGYLAELPLKQINILANEFALQICKVSGALPTNEEIYIKHKTVFKFV